MNPSAGAMAFDAVVLAGGVSSRMGRDKAFLEVEGGRLIDRQVRLLQALGPVEVLVSGAPGVRYDVGPVRVIHDRRPGHGPLGGLDAVFAATAAPSLLVLAVDMPCMSEAFLRALLQACDGCCGAVPWTVSGWEPLAAIYPRALATVVEARLASGNGSLQPLLGRAVDDGLIRPWRVPSGLERCLMNCNSPADLAGL